MNVTRCPVQRRAGETIRRLEGLVRRYEDELKIAQESAPVQDSSLAKELQKQHELTNDLLTEVEERESKVALKWAGSHMAARSSHFGGKSFLSVVWLAG